MNSFDILDRELTVSVLAYTDSASDIKSFFVCSKETRSYRACEFLLHRWLSTRTHQQAMSLLMHAISSKRIDRVDLLIDPGMICKYTEIQLASALRRALQVGDFMVMRRLMPLCNISIEPADEARLTKTLADRETTLADTAWGSVDGMVCDVKVFGTDDVLRYSTYSAVLYRNPEGLAGTFYMFGTDPVNPATTALTILLGAPARDTRASITIGRLSSGTICIRCVIGPVPSMELVMDAFPSEFPTPVQVT